MEEQVAAVDPRVLEEVHSLSAQVVARKSPLLTDQEVQEFLVNGYLLVPSTLPAEFHKHVFDTVEAVYSKEGNPGNNILPRMPVLQQIFADPNLVGALTSLLGTAMTASLAAKLSSGTRTHTLVLERYDTTVFGPTGVAVGSQYYATPKGDKSKRLGEMPSDWLVEEKPMVCKAGTTVIIAYDIWHRGMANTSSENRYMFKFQFVRMTEPVTPAWDFTSAEWVPRFPLQPALEKLTPSTFMIPLEEVRLVQQQALSELDSTLKASLAKLNEDGDFLKAYTTKKGSVTKIVGTTVGDVWKKLRETAGAQMEGLSSSDMKSLKDCLSKCSQRYFNEYVRLHERQKLYELRGPIWLAVWNWMCGEKRAIQPTVGDIDPRELDKKDPYALRAAYLLGATRSEGALSTLIGRLSAKGAPSRNAMYGLIEFGSGAVPKLLEVVPDEKQLLDTRLNAIFALGEIGTCGAEGILALVQAAVDPSKRIRRGVAESLGWVALPQKDKEEEKDNQTDLQEKVVQALCRLVSMTEEEDEQVRHHACLSLVKLKDQRAIPALLSALSDSNRYVVGYATEALLEMEETMTSQHRRQLLRHLSAARWCHITTPESSF